jgi:hypothetical protein
MNCDWMLASSDIDDGRRGWKEPPVFRKVAYAEGGRHYD